MANAEAIRADGDAPEPRAHPRRAEADELYRRFGALVVSRARYILGEEGPVTEASREVFAELLRDRHRSRREPRSTRVLHLATVRCLKILAAARAAGHDPSRGHTGLTSPRGRHPGAEEERARRVRASLEHLDRASQLLAIHHFVDEMSLGELAHLSGRSVASLRRRLARLAPLAAPAPVKAPRSPTPEAPRAPRPWLPEKPRCPVRLSRLRRLRFRELERAKARELEAHLELCAPCRARLAAMARAERAFLERTPVPREVEEILDRVEVLAAPARAPLSYLSLERVLLPSALLFLLAISLPLLAARLTAEPPRAPEELWQIEELPSRLELYATVRGRPQRVESGTLLAPDEPLQLRHRAEGRPHLFVVRVDADGQVTPLWPHHEGQSLHLDPETAPVLEGTLELGEVTGPVRVLAFASERPLEFREVEAAIDDALASGDDVLSLRHTRLEDEAIDEESVLFLDAGAPR